MTRATRLGGQKHDGALIRERGDGIDESVHEVAVVIAPPQQDDVDHLIGILIEQGLPRGALDSLTKPGIAIGVKPDLLDHLARADSQLGHHGSEVVAAGEGCVSVVVARHAVKGTPRGRSWQARQARKQVSPR